MLRLGDLSCQKLKHAFTLVKTHFDPQPLTAPAKTEYTFITFTYKINGSHQSSNPYVFSQICKCIHVLIMIMYNGFLFHQDPTAKFEKYRYN